MSRTLRASLNCVIVEGSERMGYVDQVWDLYRTTYSSIGMHLTGTSELMDYQRWDLCVDDTGAIRQLTLFKRTKWGFKVGLSGQDGSPEARRFALNLLQERFSMPGFYAEVSHKPKDIALRMNAPAVCAEYVPLVLGKDVTPVGDLEYTRSLGGLGNVTKMLVGRPRGIPTTRSQRPSCPLTPELERTAGRFGCELDRVDFDAHLGCLIF